MNTDLQVVQQEEVMAQAMLGRMIQYLQDALHATELRKQVAALQEEIASLQRQKVDLEIELSLERDAKETVRKDRDECHQRNDQLVDKLNKLKHSFDTVYGIAQSALFEVV